MIKTNEIKCILIDMDFTGVVNHLDENLTNEFFGYLVASQMNTVESISRIENDVNKLFDNF